jgi:hypothetical protein
VLMLYNTLRYFRTNLNRESYFRRSNQTVLYIHLLPPTLVSFRLTGCVTPAAVMYNEHAMQYILDNDMLPALTTVDLSEYRIPLKPPNDIRGLPPKCFFCISTQRETQKDPVTLTIPHNWSRTFTSARVYALTVSLPQ